MTVPISDVVEFSRAVELLDPAPHPLEMGVVRCASGPLHVAARTDMPGCAGRMFEWWFRFAPNTQQYLWWHPLDHVSSDWRETSATTHVGSTHLVQERLGADPTVYDLQIHFVDPREIFGEAYDDALERGYISTCVAAQLGIGGEPLRDDRGRPNMGRMTHICRDTDAGMVLRSRFWLGEGTGLGVAELTGMIPDALGLGLLQHAHTEFKYLAQFLPALYAAENREREAVALPW